MAKSVEDVKAPYLPWHRLENFLLSLKEKGVPPVIDRSLMQSYSGTEQSQIRGALRFFGFVSGDNNAKTDRLERVVAALGTDQWPTFAAELVGLYDDIIGGDVDVTDASQAQLDSVFRERGGVSGSMLVKAVRMYLTLRDQAGLPSSNHFRTRAGTPPASKRVNGGGRQKQKRARRAAGGADGASEDRPPTDTTQLVCSVPGGKIVKVWLPAELSDPEITFVLKYLKDYMTLMKQA